MREALLQRLACPLCRGGDLIVEAARHPNGEIVEGEIVCPGCAARYPVEDGIPIMLPPGLRNGDGGSAHKHEQMAFFDAQGSSHFEITRPHGCGRVYDFLLRYKFRRAMEPVPSDLRGVVALNVCCGSGMDAQFLVERGARVIGLDISVEALRGARERARCFGITYDLVAGDAEALPFAAAALDVAYIHDGLHHLEQPEIAIAEMARVARGAVVITEPAHAAVTWLAKRLGIAGEFEEAGNRVNRLTPRQVRQVLARSGAREVIVARYLMFYRHQPLRVFRYFESERAFEVFQTIFALINSLVGRWGNKLTVCGVFDASRPRHLKGEPATWLAGKASVGERASATL